MKNEKNDKAYSITNAVIHSDVQYRRGKPDDITAVWKTLTTKKEPTICKIQTRMNQTDRHRCRHIRVHLTQ